MSNLAESVAASPYADARPLRVVAVNGSPSFPSKTHALVSEVLFQLGQKVNLSSQVVSVAELVPFFSEPHSDPGSPLALALNSIAEADLVIAASPIYKGSYTGLFKHVFDLLSPSALANKPVLLIATGGSERHTLALEHQFRPLFGFFQADTLPLAVYGHDSEFQNYEVTGEGLLSRITRAVERTIPFVSPAAREASLQPVI